MAKYIPKQEAVSALINEANSHNNPVKRAYTRAAAIIEHMPSEDVQPVKHGKWILFDKDDIGRAFYCSNCRKVKTTEDFENSPLESEEYFCSRCGARMDGEQNDD